MAQPRKFSVYAYDIDMKCQEKRSYVAYEHALCRASVYMNYYPVVIIKSISNTLKLKML